MQEVERATRIVNRKIGGFDIYIGRPSKWGNPFSHKEGTLAQFLVKNRQEALAKYREYILSNDALLNSLPELEGKILGCWCKPKKCHGDVLIEIINERKYTSQVF